MTPNELPTSVEVLQQQVIELVATIEKQRQQLEKKERTIHELLQALRGKQRERIDPSQLMLFEIGELESFIEEQLADDSDDAQPARPPRKKKRGRRLIPDGLPREEILHELPPGQKDSPDRVCWRRWSSASSAITCRVIDSKISSRDTASRFVATQSTTGSPVLPKRFARCTN